jgi:hypothetical protein
MLEIFNCENLKKAVQKDLLENHNQFQDKIAKYIGLPNKDQEGTQPEYLSEWAPDRFSRVGWKYQPQGAKNKFLNHPNKGNAHGFLYGLDKAD